MFKQRISGSLLILIVGFVLFLNGCQLNKDSSREEGDTLFLDNAYAQARGDSLKQITEQTHRFRETAITRAAAKAGPAVVGINVIQVKRYVQRSPFYTEDPLWRAIFPELFRDRVYEQRVQSLGSGFLISPDGYLITNDHVVEDGEEIIVTLPGGERHDAEIVGTDRVSDISLLKIDGKNFPYLEMGNSDDLVVGEWVIALGNPFGLFELNDQPSVTVGVISAINRDWGRIPESGRVYMDMIQTDAAINHGNSGGPLVNALGQVIGMNTFIYTGSRYQEGFVGIGFAIPINRVRKVVEQIKKEGGVNRNYWLGFRVQDLNSFIVRALGLEITEGVIITQIEPGSSADDAGLLPEDVIVKVNGQPVRNTNHLLDILSNLDLQVGDTLEFTVYRNGKEKTLVMKLKEKPGQR